jgi:hypothetical protein
MRPLANHSLVKNGASVEHAAIDQDAGASGVGLQSCNSGMIAGVDAKRRRVGKRVSPLKCKAEPAMGGFDQEIAWCKERRASAIGDLREFCTGVRQFRNKVDITAVLEARASEDIKKLETIIAALEKCKGDGL